MVKIKFAGFDAGDTVSMTGEQEGRTGGVSGLTWLGGSGAENLPAEDGGPILTEITFDSALIGFNVDVAAGATFYWGTSSRSVALTEAQIKGGAGGDVFEAGSYTLEALANLDEIDLGGSNGELRRFAYFVEDNGGGPRSQLIYVDYTVDNNPPVIAPQTPVDGATDVAVDSDIIATTETTARSGSGLFHLYADAVPIESFDLETGTGTLGGEAELTDGVIMLSPRVSRPPSTEISVRWDAGALQDIAGNDIVAEATNGSWSWTTVADAAAMIYEQTHFESLPNASHTGTVVFEDVDIGAESADRTLFLLLGYLGTNNPSNHNLAATFNIDAVDEFPEFLGKSASAASVQVAAWRLDQATGTTGDLTVQITSGGQFSLGRAMLAVVRVELPGEAVTVDSVVTAVSPPGALTFTVPTEAGALVLGASMTYSDLSEIDEPVWNGLTAQYADEFSPAGKWFQRSYIGGWSAGNIEGSITPDEDAQRLCALFLSIS